MNQWKFNLAFFIVLLLLYFAMMVSLILMIVVKADKQKPQKSIRSFIICSGLLLCSILYYVPHSTYYKYNDWWVMQHSLAEIQERYGEFDLVLGRQVAYYIYFDGSGFLPDHLNHYYYIVFDDNGTITRVYNSCQPAG